ncbi:MAG: hypothetical protein H6721_31040 [Sandaracinus sp.]|nr:hypothetical protein [Sandaracinus sp.]MCB9620574.1 hypothetical protein [Sandaracinus sp.]MCB9636569.1 hypothetical protein [Sandaracinus sp.]
MRYLLVSLVLFAACSDDDGRVPLVDAEVSDSATDAGVDAASRACEADSTLGQACANAGDCNDGCTCNGLELCEAGVCVAGEDPCDDGIECTTDGCDEEADACVYETDATSCQDGNLCNGQEQCVVGVGCLAGPRLVCNDGDPCTVGSCDPETGCAFTLRDLDGDGFADARCGGLDCDDSPATGASANPGAVEICDNGVDDNCNRVVDYREPSCSGVNDTCDEAEMLPGAGSYVRTTRGLSADYAISCRPLGFDSVFAFTLTEAQDVQIVLEVDGANGGVALRDFADCATAESDTYCAAAGPVSTLRARDLPAGDYALVVKTSSAATFTLTVDLSAATPVLPVDVCDEDTVDISAGGTFMGVFGDVDDDYVVQCRPTTGTGSRKDAVYRFTLTEPRDVHLVARTFQSSSTRPTTYLSLARDCADVSSTLACLVRPEPEITRRSLEAGTYFVMIESNATSPLRWELDATFTEPVPRNEGDFCGSTVDITGATTTLPLSMLELDYGTSCAAVTDATRDGTFSFTLTEASDVVVSADVGGPHAMTVTTTCGDNSTSLACLNGSPTTSRRFLRLDPGTYFVNVATSQPTAGSMTVSTMIFPPTLPPPNDACDAPTTLTSGVEHRGTLLGSADDLASCGPAGAADVIHVLELASESNVSLVARRTDGVTEPLFLGVHGALCETDAAASCASGTPAFLNRTLPAGTYHVVVESVSGFSGPYALTALVTAP